MSRKPRSVASVARLLAVALALCFVVVSQAPAQIILRQTPKEMLLRLPGFLMLHAPDLQVVISGPGQAVPGQDVSLKISVLNKGTAPAPGTANTPAGSAYMVDIVLSTDSSFPVEWATHPVYAGLTADDFVDDMLMTGGRISNTQTLQPNKRKSYALTTHIPLRTPPGIYYLGAVVDAGDNVSELREDNNVAYFMLRIGAADDPTTNVPPGVGLWVMPYAVGNTTLNNIKPTGFTDYTDTYTGFHMVNAPFGARLGLRHGYDAALPNATIAYYRWSYRLAAPGEDWHDFTEPVGVHYSKQVGTVVSFPVYNLGPKIIATKNLYEFRPHDPPSQAGATTQWPTTDWFGDIYSGFLNSNALAEGKYEINLKVFDSAGVNVEPGPATFRFIVPTGVGPGGTINTAVATPTSDGGYSFSMYVDNRACGAFVDPPSIGSTAVADECGFLLYDPAVPANNNAAKVRISFFATHPDERAMFRFRIVRGIVPASSAEGEVGAGAAGDYGGDGSGHFQHRFTRTELLGGCPEKAAFSANLHVRAKATNGWHHHLHGLDAYYVRAFAIAPE
jgi:hypothetical protein